MPAMADLHTDAAQDALPDEAWRPVVDFLGRQVEPGEFLLAPNEFIHLFKGTIALHVRKAMIPRTSIAFYVLHKGMLGRVDLDLLREAVSLTPLYADEVFAVYGRRGNRLAAAEEHHLKPVDDHLRQRETTWVKRFTAAVVTTHNRAWALRRTLRSLTPQCDHIAVIDDGSRRWCALRNRLAAWSARATYIRLPVNVGKATALNVGIQFWLAHPGAEWISVFDDDTELAAGALETLAAVVAAAAYPADAVTFSGYRSPWHRAHKHCTIAGQSVEVARSCSGQHIHAHRSLWQGVLPIPTTYFGAPKSEGGIFPGLACDTDWWIASWCPESALKRGGDVLVVPGLVSTFGAGHSTWGGPGT